MNAKIQRQLAIRKRRILRRLDKTKLPGLDRPMFAAANIHYEIADRSRDLAHGGIGAMYALVRHLGFAAAIDERLHLLKIHLPFHESDHVLNFGYNVLCEGSGHRQHPLEKQGGFAYLRTNRRSGLVAIRSFHELHRQPDSAPVRQCPAMDLSGIGGAKDVRNLPTEFSERGPLSKEDLLSRINTIVDEAKAVLERLTAQQLLKVRRNQGSEITALAAMFSSVPYFRGHTQGIIHVTRMLLGDAYGVAWSPTTPEEGARAA